MKPPLTALALLLTALAGTWPASAQTAPKIRIALELRSEGQPARDAAAARLGTWSCMSVRHTGAAPVLNAVTARGRLRPGLPASATAFKIGGARRGRLET